jgi:hypothetical protein
VWVTSSSFLTVTVAPGLTEIESGLNAKFFMTIVEPATALELEFEGCEAVFVAPEEHAARSTAPRINISTVSG